MFALALLVLFLVTYVPAIPMALWLSLSEIESGWLGGKIERPRGDA